MSENKVSLSSYNKQDQVLIATALVQVFDKENIGHSVRVLLDAGSQSCFITQSLCKRLNFDLRSVEISSGIK